MIRLALLGAALVMAATVAIAIVVGSSDVSEPGVSTPEAATARRLLGAVLFTTPAAIGLAGAWRRQPTLLVAAGILSMLQAVVAFSGVTIVYLPGALAFLLASTYGEAAPPPPRWHAGRLAIAVTMSVVAALLVIRLTGIYGVLMLVAVGGIARLLATPRSRRAPLRADSAILGVVVLCLVIGAWLTANGSTREVCWVERSGPGGVVREELPTGQAPPTELVGTLVGTGCDSGIPTSEGILTSLALVSAAVAFAVGVPLRGAPAATRAAGTMPPADAL